MVTTNYTVSGMTCGHCVSAVTEEVAAIEGVTDVRVALAGDMVIESADKLPVEAVAAAVEEAGDYTVAEG